MPRFPPPPPHLFALDLGGGDPSVLRARGLHDADRHREELEELRLNFADLGLWVGRYQIGLKNMPSPPKLTRWSMAGPIMSPPKSGWKLSATRKPMTLSMATRPCVT